MKSYKTINYKVCGSDLMNKQYLVFKFDYSNRTLLKGFVYDDIGNPLAYAGVKVVQLNTNTNASEYLGVTFCDENGKFGVSLESLPYLQYILTIYAPL